MGKWISYFPTWNRTINLFLPLLSMKVWTTKNLLKSNSFIFRWQTCTERWTAACSRKKQCWQASGTSWSKLACFLQAERFVIWIGPNHDQRCVQIWWNFMFYKCFCFKTPAEMEAVQFKTELHAFAATSTCVAVARDGWREYFSMLAC